MNLTNDIYAQITDKMYGLIIIDADYKVVFLESTYARLLGVEQQNIQGKSIFEIFPETQLDKVVDTGKQILGEVYNSNGFHFTCNRYPLIENSKVVGAFAHWINTSDQLIDLIERLKNRIKFYSKGSKKRSSSHYCLANIVGESSSIDMLRSTIITAALSNSTILIQGETGTGKELVAHSIHNESWRSSSPFIKLNCAAIPNELIESELFGYQDGAFTGARKGGYKGKFEQANQGTIFLDEVSQLSLSAQAKLLRVIQEKEIVPLGGDVTIPVDIRIIACTNDNLKDKVAKGEFREDLFYRLNVIPIEVPPLRERFGDIPILINHFLDKYIEISGKSYLQLDEQVYDFLSNYSWPGNIRELEHAIERAVSLNCGDIIKIDDFNWLFNHNVSAVTTSTSLVRKLNEFERELIINALKENHGNKKKAAEQLSIPRPLLYQKMKRLKIEYC